MSDETGEKIASSFLWVGIGSFVSRASTILATLILAGLLTPDDFGVVSIATLITASLGLFRDMGVNQALIYQKENITKASDTALILSVFMGVILFLIGYFLSKPAATFFRNPAVEDVVRVLPFSLVISAFSSIPTSLLEKEMNFKRRAVPEITSYFTYFVVSVTLAYLGFAYWSIIIGYLCLTIVQLIATFAVSPWHPTLKFHPRILPELLGFGKFAMSNSIIVFIFRNIDDFAIGRLLGTTSLGVYSLAYRIANIPATQITNMVSKVTYPALVKMRDEKQKIEGFYLKTFHYLCVINLPIAFGIISFAPAFFHLFYGNKWDAAILPTQILAVFGLSRGLFSSSGSVFMTIGRIKETTIILLGQLFILLLCICPVILHFDIVGVCLLLTLLNVGAGLTMIVRIERYFPGIAMRKLELALPPLILSIITITIPTFLLEYLVEDLSLWSFIGAISLSGSLYLFFMSRVNRDLIREIKDIFLEGLKGK